MSVDYREKLRSLSFGPRRAARKITIEGDSREGSVTTERDDRQDVTVYVPPVSVQMDMPGWAEAKEEAADRQADAARKDGS